MLSEVIIDPVVDKFNYEVPYTKKFDRKVSLNGFGDAAQTCSAPSKYNNNEDMIRVSYLESMGYVVTEKLLTANKIPFEEYTLPNGSVRYSAGNLNSIVPVLTQQEAVDLIKTLLSPAVNQPGSPCCASKKGNAVWWILGLSGALILMNSGGSTTNNNFSLSGVPATKRKAKRKLKTVHI